MVEVVDAGFDDRFGDGARELHCCAIRIAVERRMYVRALHAVVPLATMPRIVCTAKARSTPITAESKGIETSAKPNPEMPWTIEARATMATTAMRSEALTGRSSSPLVETRTARQAMSLMARQTRSGVQGRSRCCTPKKLNASMTAL